MRYLIASTQRTGGLLLCDLLGQAGAGTPGEYIHRRPDARARRELLAAPVFGLKAQYDEIGGVGWWGPFDRVVHLVRRDVWAQARSWALAEATNQWWLRPGDQRRTAEVDPGEVDRIAQVIPEQNRGWRRWIAARAVPAITVTYEQLDRDPETTVARIVDHLGLPGHRCQLVPSLRRQAVA